MRPISILITDLDNTLWDWFSIWHSGFRPFLNELVRISGIDEDTLVAEIKKIHEKHHTSEYSFVIQELDCLKSPGVTDSEILKKFEPAIQAHRNGRTIATKLYPSVLTTLKAIKARGTRIIAFTESQQYYSTQRIRKLGLDGIIDVLYSTPDEIGLPEAMVQESRNHPDKHYTLVHTITRPLPSRLLKPSAEILKTILLEERRCPSEAIYIGDSLMKDVAMANHAGVESVFAKYGSHKDSRYDLLRRVTHWTKNDVQSEKNATAEKIVPATTLENNFSEILDHYEFVNFIPSFPPNSLYNIEQEIVIWKETVDTQRHFNDLQLQIRSILVTLITAVVGGAGYALSQNYLVSLFGWKTSLGVLISIAGIVAIWALRFFDKGYHQFLRGAVENGSIIEDRLAHIYPGICLANRITEASRRTDFFFIFRFNSKLRLNFFYWCCYGVIFALGVVCLLSSNEIQKDTLSNIPSDALHSYFDRRYMVDVEQATRLARHYLEDRLAKKEPNPVVIIDIDETALTTWPILTRGNFAYDPQVFEKFASKGTLSAIFPVLQLYKFAKSQGVKVVFITSRRVTLQEPTISNLRFAGFDGDFEVILKPAADKRPSSVFKAEARDKIRKEGGTIVLNVGDQISDLSLPIGPEDFLIPNPFYTAR